MTDRKNPTIGILSQEISRVVIPECIEGCSYISAAYVKYLEAAGAHVVPILTTWSDDEVRTIFQSINGVFIPGGGASLVDSMFMHNVRLLLRLAEDANNNGDYFPIWGTCLGFEAMLVACGGASFVGASLLGDVDAVDLAMPAKLTDDARKSALLASASEDVLVSLATMPIKYHFHKKCVYKDDFQRSTELTAKYSVITYDEDRKKRTFVSLVEGKRFWQQDSVRCFVSPYQIGIIRFFHSCVGINIHLHSLPWQ